MSRTNDLVIEMLETSYDRKIAELLQISHEELMSLEWDIEKDESEDGTIYNYRVEFKEAIPSIILNKINGLENESTVYIEPWELDEDYEYNEQFDAIIENKNIIERFDEELKNLKTLNELEIRDKVLKDLLTRQIYISAVGTMETYLSDTFINLTFDNKKFFRNFVETHPEFKQRKFDLREIFIQKESINDTAKKIMLETIYHNLPSVSEMFKTTFEIKFPKIKDIYQIVLKRHDLVHRNGKTKEGVAIEIDIYAIQDVIKVIYKFVHNIENILIEKIK